MGYASSTNNAHMMQGIMQGLDMAMKHKQMRDNGDRRDRMMDMQNERYAQQDARNAIIDARAEQDWQTKQGLIEQKQNNIEQVKTLFSPSYSDAGGMEGVPAGDGKPLASTGNTTIDQYLARTGDLKQAGGLFGVMPKKVAPDYGNTDVSVGDGYFQKYRTINGQVDQNYPIGERFQKKGGITINNGDNSNKFNEKVDEGLASQYLTISNNAIDAQNQLNSLGTLQNIDIAQGGLEPAKNAVKKLAISLGYDSEAWAGQVAGAESFNAVAGKMLAQSLAEQKGPQTDKDATRMSQTIARLGNTKEANQFIVNMAINMNKRKIHMAEYMRSAKSEGIKFEESMASWNNQQKPMVSRSIDKNSGLPVFYYDYVDNMRKANPDATQEEINNEWLKISE